MVLGHLVSHLLLRATLPAGSNPRWYHALAIVGAAILVIPGAFGLVVNLSRGDLVLASSCAILLALGIASWAAIRRALLLRTLKEKTDEPYADAYRIS